LPDDDAIATDIARVLLRYGASATRANAYGASAIEAARNRGLDDAADLMEAS
jgi:hypothetical protein